MTIRNWAQLAKLQQWRSRDTLGIGVTHHLNQLVSSILGINRNLDKNLAFFHGFHFLYNNQENIQLGTDGYDNYQAPKGDNGQELFKRRLWVKGNITFEPKVLSTIDCLEKITSVRQVSDSVFVQISREFNSDSAPVLTESRTLMYTNQDYQKSNKVHEIGIPDISKQIDLNPTDLLKYSMLTYNLHKIHYDVSYCQTVEKLPSIILQGPFMITLLLTWFTSQFPELTIKSFNYKNLRPCFVTDSLTLSLIQKDNNFILSMVNEELKEKYIEGTLQVY